MYHKNTPKTIKINFKNDKKEGRLAPFYPVTPLLKMGVLGVNTSRDDPLVTRLGVETLGFFVEALDQGFDLDRLLGCIDLHLDHVGLDGGLVVAAVGVGDIIAVLVACAVFFRDGGIVVHCAIELQRENLFAANGFLNQLTHLDQGVRVTVAVVAQSEAIDLNLFFCELFDESDSVVALFLKTFELVLFDFGAESVVHCSSSFTGGWLL